jgi:hypothetical protein
MSDGVSPAMLELYWRFHLFFFYFLYFLVFPLFSFIFCLDNTATVGIQRIDLLRKSVQGITGLTYWPVHPG